MLSSCLCTKRQRDHNRHGSWAPDIGEEDILKNPLLLKHASKELQDCASLVMMLVRKNGLVISYASDRLREQYDVGYAAIKQNGKAIRYISPNTKGYKQLVLIMLHDNPTILMQEENITEFLSQGLLDDRDIVIKAAEQNGLILACLVNNKYFENDKELIITALKQNGLALKYVKSHKMMQDKDLVLTALNQNGFAIQYVCDKLKDVQEVAEAAVSQKGESLKYCTSDTSRNDRQIVLAAVKQSGTSLRYASQNLRNSFEIVSVAVSQNGKALKFASTTLRDNVEIVMLSVASEYASLQFASQRLRSGVLYDHMFSIFNRYSTPYYSFLATFLFALSGKYSPFQNTQPLSPSSSPINASMLSNKTPLSLLIKLGIYSGVHIKRKIAEYTGVQIGREWHMIERVVWYLRLLKSSCTPATPQHAIFSPEEVAFLCAI